MKEVWKDIAGYEGLYQVSNLGNVKSLAKEWKCGHDTKRQKECHVLNIQKDQRGYPMVQLFKDGAPKTKRIHTLVWDTFGNRARNGRILNIDHIDENKNNNHISNLQLLPNRDNKIKGLIAKGKYKYAFL